MIPKQRLIYRIDAYEEGAPRPFNTTYCKPENINYWLHSEEDDSGIIWTVNPLLVTPQKWEELFSVLTI